jgi:hypothetical protein
MVAACLEPMAKLVRDILAAHTSRANSRRLSLQGTSVKRQPDVLRPLLRFCPAIYLKAISLQKGYEELADVLAQILHCGMV